MRDRTIFCQDLGCARTSPLLNTHKYLEQNFKGYPSIAHLGRALVGLCSLGKDQCMHMLDFMLTRLS